MKVQSLVMYYIWGILPKRFTVFSHLNGGSPWAKKMISLTVRPHKCLLEIYKKSYKCIIMWKQGLTIWRGKCPNLRNTWDKAWKILLACTILAVFTKNWMYVLREWGRVQVKNTHLVTVIAIFLDQCDNLD